MVITKRGKCEVCEAPVTETCEFMENLDLFEHEPETRLKGDLLVEVKKWRAKKTLCPVHLLQAD